MTLFTEIFPVNNDRVPQLTVYTLSISGKKTSGNEIGGKLRFRLQNAFNTHWYWDKEKQYLLTDAPITGENIEGVLKQVWVESDSPLKDLETITLAPDIQPSTQGIADFVAHALLDDVQDGIEAVLAKATQEKEKHSIRLVCKRFGWVVDGQPAVSISVRSELKYKGDLNDFIRENPNDNLIGLHALDKTKPKFGSAMEITEIVGKLGENNRRLQLTGQATTEAMKQIITQAADDALVVRLKGKYSYVADALTLQILNKDYARFDISEKLQIPSNQRAGYVQPIAKIVQKTGLVGSSYSTKSHADLFPQASEMGYSWTLRFADNKIKRLDDFRQIYSTLQAFGPYKPANGKTIRIAIVNTQPGKPLDKFKAMLRQELKDNLGYELTRTPSVAEINLPNPSRPKLEQAINQIATANPRPDIVLGIIPRDYGGADDESDDWTLYDHFKYLTLNHNLPSQVVQPRNADNKWAVHNVILGILAKTGTIPYVLAEPITYADFIVGIDVSRRLKKKQSGTINTAAIAKIFTTNGEFLRYSIREATVEGETIPPQVLRAIFPIDTFGGKTIIIHRDGRLQAEEKAALEKWGSDIGATFYFVDVVKSGTPRIYSIGKDSLPDKATKGSIFKLSDNEALLVSSDYPDTFDATPQPLRIVAHSPFPLDRAIHSVLSLTLLHYGSERPPRLPVTTHYADKISTMASRGIKPAALDGKIPFWL